METTITLNEQQLSLLHGILVEQLNVEEVLSESFIKITNQILYKILEAQK